MVEDTAFIIVGSLISIFGGIVGIIWARSRNVDPSIIRKKVKLYEDTIKELEYESMHWKGKFNQTKQLPSVEGDFNLSDVGSVEALIQTVLPKVKGLLPKDLQGLADDPNVVKYAMQLYQQNPDKAKQLLGKFLKKGGQAPEIEASL